MRCNELSYKDLFWHFLQKEEATLSAPFTTLNEADRAATVTRINQAIEGVLSQGLPGSDEGGGGPGGGPEGHLTLQLGEQNVIRGIPNGFGAQSINMGRVTEQYDETSQDQPGIHIRSYEYGVVIVNTNTEGSVDVVGATINSMFLADRLIATEKTFPLPHVEYTWAVITDEEPISLSAGATLVIRPRGGVYPPQHG